ncbi:hypothetical protein K458DRAFT_23460 [Lentithecium fluviatile CBS 122367]|uniref:Xylanolytic transcriptional activator regulatory domain-containing protein n=1 Tax=Lentithecium fluviatile CBS 122367 TaxID=1168545 RepID=A0A6G1J582_9PLEO|nr:hypothetical protein K458DRAFT_23460 [Lentithecium fluviatile CBS 122367]
MATFRPLQPAPMDEEQTHQPQGRPLLTQKPKRTVTLGACVACRKRKSKVHEPERSVEQTNNQQCDGLRPMCTCCAQKETECVYELGPNEKPSQAMKRKNEEMQGELSNLRQLYDFLRLRPEHEALEILRRIRARSPDTIPSRRIQELAELVRHGELFQPPYSPLTRHHLTLPPLRLALDSPSSDSNHLLLPSMLSFSPEEPSSQRRRHASDADVSARSDSQSTLPLRTSIGAILRSTDVMEEPSDCRLAAARSWTKVTDDSHFLAGLLSAWHTWEYIYYHFFDWDIFLDDLSNNRTDFCSELLVNALLATASFQSPLVKDRSKPFSENAMTRFYREARRLWELEEGQDSLPRLQAALCLFMVLGKHGRDKVGHTFLLEACRIARSLGLFRLAPSASQKPPHVCREKWEKARAVSAWALFNFQSTMSFTYSFPPILQSQPPVAVPYDDTPAKEALFRSECARNVIILDCSKALLEPYEPTTNLSPKPEQIEVLYLRLKAWYDTRPHGLLPEIFPSPENFLIAMQHHVSVVRLFQPFISNASSVERLASYRDHARSLTSTAIKELRKLIILHDRRHGWASAIPFVLHPIVVTSYGSLEEVALQDQSQLLREPSEAYQGLLTCLQAMITLSSYVFYAQPLFRLLTQTCQTLQIPLPADIVSRLNYYQSKEWTKNAANVVSSQYIADIRKTATDVNARMDAIISRWDALAISKEGEKASETDS